MGHRGGRFAMLLQQMEGGDPGVVAADAGVIKNGGARPGRQDEVTGVDAAMRPRDNDPAGRIGRKHGDSGCKYLIHLFFFDCRGFMFRCEDL
jgi:hypothetical protein